MILPKQIAVYLRISLEDKGKGGDADSESIVNQRSIILQYLHREPDLAGIGKREFIDDGYTGTNMERPGFQEMINQINAGTVDCVIVKDFSRFGRDYIAVGDYLEHVFPFMGVRFISVNDRYDSANYVGTSAGIDMAMKNIIHEQYSRDLSEKCKSAMKVRIDEGKYVTAVPYGYVHDPAIKHHMVIDPEAAEVVRLIFDMAASGEGSGDIAKYLNAHEIPTPNQHARINNKTVKNPLWSRQSVLRILRNEKYLGKMITHLRESRHIRDRNMRKTEREEWVIREDAHDAIVSQALFTTANANIRTPVRANKQQRSGNKSQRSLPVYCGICGRSMQKQNNKSYYCPTRDLVEESECRFATASIDSVEGMILLDLRMKLSIIEEYALSLQSVSSQHTADQYTRSIADLNRRLQRMNEDNMALYLQYKNGKISKDQYFSAKTKLGDEQTQAKEQITKWTEYAEQLKKEDIEDRENLALLEPFLQMANISDSDLRAKAVALLERVEITGANELRIIWKCENIFAIPYRFKRSA